MILDTFRAIPKNIVFWLKFSERREKSTAGQNPGIPGDIKICCDPRSEKILKGKIMKPLKEIKQTTHVFTYGMYGVDIIEYKQPKPDQADFEVYLYRHDIRIKDFMFGLVKAYTPTLADVKEIVLANIEQYILAYDNEFSED